MSKRKVLNPTLTPMRDGKSLVHAYTTPINNPNDFQNHYHSLTSPRRSPGNTVHRWPTWMRSRVCSWVSSTISPLAAWAMMMMMMMKQKSTERKGARKKQREKEWRIECLKTETWRSGKMSPKDHGKMAGKWNLTNQGGATSELRFFGALLENALPVGVFGDLLVLRRWVISIRKNVW